ncbi:hypothetical protein [Paraburkholderia lycopersici]|uniref:Tetratricopeptide repeat-containing protein n=1 Tax=Paraburkholderia lycopersici TaxID=416944 RepID=A0A1G6P734_9BURK|nr:hypothetical protein [Paraburkholderia lycopersici]SDC76032.1 hypothetical protein SAMN05421548_11050 [Paraburkholderia lycopersici]
MTQRLTPNAEAIDDALADFAQAALGGGLAPEAAERVADAGRLRERPGEALALLERARAAAPGHPVPLIALYRFYFYGHRLAEARAVGEGALSIVRTVLGAGFGVEPPPRDAVRYDAAVRFYLFTLKGLAYLHMRLGELESARRRLDELRRLDPEDQVGSAVLLHVLARREGDVDDDGAGASPSAYPARGWAVQP